MVVPNVPHSKRHKQRRPKSPGAKNQAVDSRVLLIPLGLAFLAIAWNILRLFRSLVRPISKPVLRREHAPFSSWNYDWCPIEKKKRVGDDAPSCAYALPIDLEDFLPQLPDEPLLDMFPDPADLFDMEDDDKDAINSKKKNDTTTDKKEMTDDLDNHIDRLGNMLLNPANFIMYPPTPKILVEARRNFTLSSSSSQNKTGVNTGIQRDYFALISRRGKGDTHDFYNQDRAVLVDPFPLKINGKLPKPTKKGGSNPLHNNFFLAIFDGHGLSGHVKADHAASTLPKILLEQLEMHKTKQPLTDHQIRQSIQSSFWDTHRQGPLIHDSGCTASTIVRLGHTLYFANAGDSRSMLVQVDMEQRQVNITHVTKPHKPNDPTERQRIVKTGCIVIDPIPFRDSTARVADKPDSNGAFSGMALAMSRSLGDYDLEHCSVIPEPTITSVDLTQHEKHSHRILLAVSVSDGLFDEVSLEEIAQGLSHPYLNRNTYLGQFASPLELAAEDLVRTASDRWLMNTTMLPYRDDITIAVRQVQ